MQEIISSVREQMNSARVDEAYARLANAYSLKPNDHPPIVELEGGCTEPPYSPFEIVNDPAKNLECQLLDIEGNLSVGTDYVPMLEMSLPFGTVMVPEAFGCAVEWTPDGVPWARPAITTAREAQSVRKPKVREASMIQRIKEHVEYAHRVVGDSIPMQVIDLQSPYSAACQIWDAEELMSAMFSAPKAVHDFLRIVTDFSMEFLQDYVTWFDRPAFPGRNFPSIPEDIGPNIADDTPAIMLSPEQYEEFALPYNVEVAEAFGGLSIHCCGDYTHQLDNHLKIPNLRAIQCHVGPGEMKPQPLVHKINGKVILWCDWNEVARGHYDNARDLYQDFVLPQVRQLGEGLILQGLGGNNRDEQRQNYEWLVDQFAPETAPPIPKEIFCES
jgi:hypothetical protein